MSLSNDTENAALKMFLQGTDPAYRAAGTAYLALFTSDPTETGSVANECSYTGYDRVAMVKASAWVDGGSSFTNAAIVQFGKRTDAGATQTVSHFALVDTATKTTPANMMISGQLSANLDVSQNIQPQFGTADLTITAD
jgi:hypothetical protein